jgi:hypothetical protein
MKYIFLRLKVINGEYEYSSQSVHQISKKSNINLFAEKYAKTFYGGNSYIEDNYYFFNGGEVAVRVSNVVEITEAEYNVLNKFGSL